jgi:hypothetical protein
MQTMMAAQSEEMVLDDRIAVEQARVDGALDETINQLVLQQVILQIPCPLSSTAQHHTLAAASTPHPGQMVQTSQRSASTPAQQSRGEYNPSSAMASTPQPWPASSATPLYGPLFPGVPLPIAVQLPAAAPLAPPDPMALLKQQQLQVVLPAMAAVAKDAPSYVYAMRMMQPWFVLPNPSLVDAKAVVRLLNPDITEANCDVKGRELLVERSRQIRQIQSIIACMQQRAAMLPAFTPSHP